MLSAIAAASVIISPSTSNSVRVVLRLSITASKLKLAVVQVQQHPTDISAARGLDGFDETSANAQTFKRLITELEQLNHNNRTRYQELAPSFNRYYSMLVATPVLIAVIVLPFSLLAQMLNQLPMIRQMLAQIAQDNLVGAKLTNIRNDEIGALGKELTLQVRDVVKQFKVG